MAEEKVRTKSAHYKRVKISSQDDSLTVGKILGRALNGRFEQPDKRKESVSETVLRLMNRTRSSGNFFIAEIVQYEIGKSPQSLTMKTSGNYFPIDAFPKWPGNRQLVDSSAIICLQNDHMLAVTSQGLRIGNVEAYLAWLIAEIEGDDHSLILQDLPSKELSQLATSDDYVTSAKIGSRLSVDPNRSKTSSVVFQDNTAKSLLELLQKKFSNSIVPENIEEWSKIVVDIMIKYSRPKNKAEARPALINFLGSLSGIPDDSLTLQTKKGKTLVGDAMRLKWPVKVSVVDGNIDFNGIVKPIKEAMEGVIEEASKS